jgi:PAS domain S-box-containing protein
MNGRSRAIGLRLTARFLLTLALLGGLSLANYLILESQIAATRPVAEVLNLSGNQRALLQQSALAAQQLVSSHGKVERTVSRGKLLEMAQLIEDTHFGLIRKDSPVPPPESVKGIYFDSPWMLDMEMRTYMVDLRSLAISPDRDLQKDNPQAAAIRETAASGRLSRGLDAVVAAYQHEAEQKTDRLQGLAAWSFGSTLSVLAVTGWFVFRPVVRRVREDVRELAELSEGLERRVAERTALAEQRTEALILSERALRNSEALYHSLVDNLPLYVLRKDLEGRFTFVNYLMCELLRKPPEDVLGKTDFDFYPDRLADKYRGDDHHVVRSGEVLREIEEHRTPDGKALFVEILKSPVRDGEGRITGTQTVFLDVTARVEAERKLVQAERLAAIGQMVAGVAHESRNALQQIQACCGLLKWRLLGDGEARELLADLQKAQDRLHRLFEDLRGYAAPLAPQRCRRDVRQIVAESWEALAPLRKGREVSLREPAFAGDPHCEVDALQCEQVFRNVLENALAACADPVVVEVAYSEAQMDGRAALRVAVRDNGPGLSAEQRERIFQPFYTTKSHGSGLGMAIAARIVEAHGGRIAVGGTDAGGTEIVIALPRGA